VADAQISVLLLRGAELHRQGRLAEAEALYRQVLATAPRQPDALHLLGLIANAAGRTAEAIDLIRQALAVQPDLAAAHYNLGRILQGQGAFDQAEQAYCQALASQPGYIEALENLGGTLQAQGKLDEAEHVYRRALELAPERASAWSNLGTLLQARGAPAESLKAYDKALALAPHYVEAHHNRGEALSDLHQLDEAVASYDRALELRPDYADAHFGRAAALLRKGALREGFAEYEWRRRRHDAQQRVLPGPEWDGVEAAGRRLLVYTEQGYGDAVQFARYVPLLAARGATVLLECQPALVRLFTSLAGVSQVLARGEPLPAFDAHVPLMSLPRLFGTELESIPSAVPYLAPPARLLGEWRTRIGSDGQRRVGLVWAGTPNPSWRSPRSVPASALAPLASISGVRFFSLQKDEAERPPFDITDLSRELDDFASTVAALSCLDLVISVDTAAAHLAGALGRPVWLMLPQAADWRWLLDREDSPWYPTMWLFRQPIWGDWQSVVQAVAGRLAMLRGS
jgi:tetratricopeptide (TPR) repeat protein